MGSAPDRARVVLSHDTSDDVEVCQLERWGTMSSIEVARTLNLAWVAGRRMALIGLRERYPLADEAELHVRLAVQTLGLELAGRIHGDVSRFADSAIHGR